jgi:hypothetical protein
MKRNTKPLYYNEYVLPESLDSNKIYLLFTILTIFVFLGSLIDLIYSYLTIDLCQDQVFILSLNTWFKINGTYGIFYYIFMVIIFYKEYEKYDNYQKGYNKMINTNISNKSNIFCFLFIFLTTILLSSFIMGSYIFFSFFGALCKSYAINIYVWTRIITGILTSIFYFIYYLVLSDIS